MRIVDCEQGTAEWFAARLGLPTASRFDQILTSKTLKYAASAEKYRNELLAETLMGQPADNLNGSYWVERGAALEPKARESYEFVSADVRRVGFVLRDDGRVGCSPDGLVGEDGGLELKCPAPATHVGYLLDPQTLVAAYAHQVQGCLYITGRAWWDAMSYCPGMDPVIVRVTPDEKYQTALAFALEQFLADLDAAKAKLGILQLQEAA